MQGEARALQLESSPQLEKACGERQRTAPACHTPVCMCYKCIVLWSENILIIAHFFQSVETYFMIHSAHDFLLPFLCVYTPCLLKSSINVHFVFKLLVSGPLYILKNTLTTPDNFLLFCGFYLTIFPILDIKTKAFKNINKSFNFHLKLTRKPLDTTSRNNNSKKVIFSSFSHVCYAKESKNEQHILNLFSLNTTK